MAKRSVRASEALRASERVARLEKDTLDMHRLMFRDPLRYANAVVDLDHSHVTRERFTEEIGALLPNDEMEMLTFLSNAAHSTPAEDLIQLTRWARTRIVYTVDPTMANAVVGTDWGKTVIPGDVLRRLPYPNPLVLLPEYLYVPHDEPGILERYEAFVVTGVENMHRRSSDDPDNDSFVLHYLGRLVHKENLSEVRETLPAIGGGMRKVSQVVGMRVVTPLRDATMDERRKIAVQEVLRNKSDWSNIALPGFNSEQEAVEVTERTVDLGLSLLTYMVTDEVDSTIERVKRRPATKKQSELKGDTTFVEMGFRIGSALRKSQSESERQSTTESGRKSPSPHIRRAHFHSFRRGPGRQEVFLKWLPPIAVAWSGDEKPKTTIHVR